MDDIGSAITIVVPYCRDFHLKHSHACPVRIIGWTCNGDRSPTKGNLEPSWNPEPIACRNQRVGAQIDGTWHTTLYQRQLPSTPGGNWDRWVQPLPCLQKCMWTQRQPFCGAPPKTISEDFFPCRNGSNKGFSITPTIYETRPAIVIYRASLILRAWMQCS